MADYINAQSIGLGDVESPMSNFSATYQECTIFTIHSMMGSWHNFEAREVRVRKGAYAQHKEVMFVEFLPARPRARKWKTFYEKLRVVIVKGLGLPAPPPMMG